MRVIWKFPLPVGYQMNEIEMPVGAKVVHVGNPENSKDSIYLWAEVNQDRSDDKEMREFLIVWTGEPIDDGYVYVGTSKTPASSGGTLIFHVYEREPDETGR